LILLLQPGQPGPVDADESEHLRRQGAARVVATALVEEPDPGQVTGFQALRGSLVHSPSEVDESPRARHGPIRVPVWELERARHDPRFAPGLLDLCGVGINRYR